MCSYSPCYYVQVLDHVLRLSHGDLRRCITMLQSVCQLVNPTTVDSSTVWAPTTDQLDEVAAVVPNFILDNVLQSAKSGRFDEMQSNIKVRDVILLLYFSYSESRLR